MSVTLADLLVDHPEPVIAYPDEPVTVAMERMLEHDYSQLPVVIKGEPDRLIGLISTTSIARATLHLRAPPTSLRVHHASDGRPTTAKVSDELWDTLDDVREGQPVIVLRADGSIEGLLTAHDFTAYLRRLAEDSVLVADIEAAVKQLILRQFQGADEKLKSAVDKQVRGQHSSLVASVRRVVGACLSSAGVDAKTLSAPAYKAAFDEHVVGKVDGEFDKLTFAQFNGIFWVRLSRDDARHEENRALRSGFA